VYVSAHLADATARMDAEAMQESAFRSVAAGPLQKAPWLFYRRIKRAVEPA
jgi:hypothetical protein